MCVNKSIIKLDTYLASAAMNYESIMYPEFVIDDMNFALTINNAPTCLPRLVAERSHIHAYGYHPRHQRPICLGLKHGYW